MSVEHPWILATAVPLAFLCERCGASLTVGASVDVNVYLSAGRAFIAEHATCLPLPAAVEMERAGAPRLPGLEGASGDDPGGDDAQRAG